MVKPAATQPDPQPRAVSPAAPNTRRWLLFVHQLPASPSNLRVRTWRRLQQLGAIPLRQAVYVLPDTAAAREDFEWLKSEIKGLGGEATVFSARAVDTWSDDELVEEFRRTRQEAYAGLATEIEQLLRRLRAGTRRAGTRAPAAQRRLDALSGRLTALEHIDFFGSAGRDRVAALLSELEAHTRAHRHRATGAATVPGQPVDAGSYSGRLWVTRPRPGVDRMSSAWLIRRFIDPQARFGFARDRDAVGPTDGVPFDMFGVEFSHVGDGCTFETLCAVFAIDDPAVARVATIVHDLDLKDGRFDAPETPTVGALIDGLQLATDDDHDLLERGITLFESLYRSFAQSVRTPGPRPVARTGHRRRRAAAQPAANRRRR